MKSPLWVSKAVWLLTLFWLAGWFIKAAFYIPYLFDVCFQYPASNDFFPPFFQSEIVSGTFYLLPAISIFNLTTDNIELYRFNAILMAACAALLCLHLNTYNDATFVTSFWAALWLCWFTFCFERADNIESHAVRLGHGIIGMVFLAGFVGKLTPEYFSGEAFRHIFLNPGDPNTVNNVLSFLRVSETAAIYRAISWAVIVVEGLLVINLLAPTRWMRAAALVILPVLTLFSTWRILSVLLPLAGVLIAVDVIDISTRKAVTA